MGRRTRGMKPKVAQWVDYSKDLGLIDPKDLIEAVKLAGAFVYDLETTGLNPREDRIDGIAFYVPGGKGRRAVRAWYPFVPYTFQTHDKEGNLVDLRPAMDQEETIEALRPIWEIEDVISIAHHAKFDTAFLYFQSGTPRPIVIRNIEGDSMLADFAGDERRRQYGLKVRVKQEFGHSMTTYADAVRGQSLLSFCHAKPLAVYAMDDCYWTWRLHERMIASLREQSPPPENRKKLVWSVEKQHGRPMGKLEKVYWGIDTKVSKILMEMENAGCLIDWRWLVEVDERIDKDKEEILNRIEQHLRWPLNPNSTKATADALFALPPDGLGLPTAGIPIGKTGDPSTADKVIKHFARFHPLVADILKWRSLDTVQGGFVKKLIKLAQASPDGRVYAHFNQIRTVIARLSSSDPINFQNQPREKNLVRKAYVAFREGTNDDKNILLLGGDYGQIELRVAAHLSEEENMIEVYQMGGICTSQDGGPCDRYMWYECHACDHKARPLEPTPNTFICAKCKSTNVEHQARCRHVDLHQRTAEDAGVRRNPLAKNCVTGDALILTEHGLLRMDEVVTEEGRTKKTIGIMSDDGKIRPTESTWGGGVQPVADVHMEYGLKVTATYDHKFYVMREGKVEQIPVEDLKPGDPVLIMAGRDIHGKEIDLPQVEVEAHTSFKDVDLPRFLDEQTARFLGYFVSEGRAEVDYDKGRYQIQFGFGPHDPDTIEDVTETFGHLLGPDRVTRKDTADVKRLTGASKKLGVWLEALGCGLVSADKAIPSAIRRAPWSLKREFFRALFEGDGTCKRVGKDSKSYALVYTSKSEELIRQIQAEMMNVNILGYVGCEMRKTQKGKLPYWTWTVRRQSDLARFAEMVGFISERKQGRLIEALQDGVADYSNRFLDGVEPLLETIYDKVKRKQKDKLREVIRRKENPVRFGDTRVSLLANALPEEINAFIDAGVWTAKITKIEDAGEAEVYDVYEPERTAMVVSSCVVADCNFGLLYRMGAPKFCVYADLFDADGMPMVPFAKDIIGRWHAAYPAVDPFHEKTEWELEQNDWIAQTLFGRRRRLDQEKRFNRYRAVTQGIQFQVSGSAQDIMKTGMIRVIEEREKKIANSRPAERKLWQRFRMLMQVHDEIMMEVHQDIKPEATELVKNAMEGVGRGYLRVPLTFDVRCGTSWDDIH